MGQGGYLARLLNKGYDLGQLVPRRRPQGDARARARAHTHTHSGTSHLDTDTRAAAAKW